MKIPTILWDKVYQVGKTMSAPGRKKRRRKYGKVGGGGTDWSSYWATLISATVENAAPTDVVLTFPTAQTSLTDTDFTIAGFTVDSASWAGSVLTLVLDTTVVATDTLVVTFIKTGDTANVTNNVWSDYVAPVGFGWAFPVTFQKNNAETFRVDPTFNIETYADIAVAVTYYVATTGSDAATGLDAEHPLKKLSTALAKADVDRVYMAAGWYIFGDGVNAINPTRNVKIIGVGNVYLSSDAYAYATDWAAVDSHYEATWAAGACSVIDISATDAYGDFRNYTVAVNVAGVDATPGSFIVSGGKLYIRTLSGGAPNTSYIKILYGAIGIAIAKDSLKFYFENLNFYTYSGNTVGNGSSTGGLKFYAKDCNFMYSGLNSNNINLNGVDEVILQGCKYAHGIGDGLATAVKNTKVTNVIEIDCEGYDNGLSTGTEFNGSSLHGANIGVRLNCEYQHNRGSNIHDVDSGTMSLNLGVSSHHAEPAGTPANYLRANFSIGAGNSTAKMWCDSCVSEDSYRDFVATGSGVILYKKNCTGDASDEEITSGDIQAY